MKPVMPYLTADASAVDLDPWEYEQGAGQWTELGSHVPDWDYHARLRLRRRVRIDPEAFALQTRLAHDVVLLWSVGWRCVHTRVGDAVAPVTVVPGAPQQIEVELRGDRIGGELDLLCRVVLGAPYDGPAGSARAPGSILFEDRQRVALVGGAARFPVAVIDFADAGLDPDASFVVDVPDDLDTPVHGGLLLLVNRRDDELVSAVQSMSGGRSADPLVQRLEEDAAVALLRHAVNHARELEESHDDDTLGGALYELAQRVPGGLERLAGLRAERTATLETALVGEVRRLGLGRSLS